MGSDRIFGRQRPGIETGRNSSFGRPENRFDPWFPTLIVANAKEFSILQVRAQISGVSRFYLVSSARSSGIDTSAKVVERSLMAYGITSVSLWIMPPHE